MLCQLSVILLHLISFHSMRFVAFSVGTTFLWLLVCFAAVIKLSRPDIHTSGWIQYSTPGIFFLYLFLSTNFIPWKLFFACAVLDAISVLLIPWLYFIKLHEYLNWSLCLSKMLICGHILFRLITIIYVFLLFNSSTFILPLLQQCLIIIASHLYFLQSIQYYQGISKCLLCALLILIPGYPFRFCIIISL